MNELYDQITNITVPSLGDDRYIDGMQRGIELCAEIIKKRIDDESRITRINRLLDMRNKITELSEYIEEVDPTFKLTQEWQKLLNALTTATEELIK